MGAGVVSSLGRCPQAEVLDALEHDVDRLIEDGLREMGPSELANYQRRVRRSMNRLEYQAGRAFAAFDAMDGGEQTSDDTVAG